MSTVRKKGLLVAADDLQVGRYYCVHGPRYVPDEPFNLAGQAFQVRAINLPFVVGRIVSDPSNQPLTFDVRYLAFMNVTPEYVQAQLPAHVSAPS